MLSQLKGIHFAMEFLTKNQKRLLMTGDGKLESNWDGGFISAEGKDVIVIGVSLVSFTVTDICTGSMVLSDAKSPPYSNICVLARWLLPGGYLFVQRHV